jgi:hypothetical protein
LTLRTQGAAADCFAEIPAGIESSVTVRERLTMLFSWENVKVQPQAICGNFDDT